VRGCLFTLLLGGIVVAFLVVVGLPPVAAGILTAGLTAAGLQADDTTVTVSSNPPTDLLTLHADTVHVSASDATFRGMEIGELDLALGDVNILDRTAGTLDGELRDVTIRVQGGEQVTLDRIVLAGDLGHVTTTTTISRADAEALVADAVERQTGVRPTSVRLVAPDRVTVRAGITVKGRLAVTDAGNLVLVVDAGALAGTQAMLVRGGQDVPIRLTSVQATEDGALRLTGDLTIGLLG
jgi:hypothetical protein